MALGLKRKFVLLWLLSVSSLCDSEVTTLKSRSSISTETRIQSQRSSNLSHRIWRSDCLECSLSFPFLCGLKPHLGPASVWLTTVVNWATSPLTQMCLLPSYVKRAYKSPLVSFHPLSFMHLHYAFFFFDTFLSCSHFSLQKQTVKHWALQYVQHQIPNTNTLRLFLEECPCTTSGL